MPSAMIVDHLWFVVFAQVAGLISAAMTRATEGTKSQTSYQAVFLGAMLIVGLITISGLRLGAGYWMISGTTLDIMLLMATCDLGSKIRVEE